MLGLLLRIKDAQTLMRTFAACDPLGTGSTRSACQGDDSSTVAVEFAYLDPSLLRVCHCL